MKARAIHFVLCLAAMVPASASTIKLDAPNVVEITPQLTTAGQPTADALSQLKARGYDAVIYLAPPTVSDAVRDEAVIVAKQGLTYVNIPIVFSKPTDADFENFAAVLAGMGDKKVLVHCQVNLRASSMVFLYRTLKRKEPPEKAYEAVAAVWSPHGAWKPLIEGQLRKAGVAFEIY